MFQRVTYQTKKPTHDVRVIAELEGGRVKPGRQMEWKEQIIVPPLPQSSLVGCDLISIEYYVKVRKHICILLTYKATSLVDISYNSTPHPTISDSDFQKYLYYSSNFSTFCHSTAPNIFILLRFYGIVQHKVVA